MTSAFELLGESGLKIALCSRGLMRIPHLAAFLNARKPSFEFTKTAGPYDLYVGWGNKPSGRLAKKLATDTDVPFLLLEDAFFRSLAPQSVSGEHAIGLTLDDTGIYYDATQPNRLERLIKESCNNPVVTEGEDILKAIKKYRVSKYNNFEARGKTQLYNLTDQVKILVIDQTFEDLSIFGAGANAKTFEDMISAAFDENPGAEIIVKLHPEVMAGRKRGYLKEHARQYGCRLLSENINPWDLLDQASTVYTVSSQLGFEALVAGKEVRCFAMPFYAGWGLTSDEKVHSSRSLFKPNLAELTVAACSRYCNYVDPFNQKIIKVDEAIKQLSFRKNLYQQNTELAAFYQISNWKKKRVREMFMKPARKRLFYYTRKGAVAAAKAKGGALVTWASRIDQALEDQCKRSGVPLYRLEDGFIRSVGLGANLHQAMSLVLDSQGIYYDETSSSQLEQLLETHKFSDEMLTRAEQLARLLVDHTISKYNLSGSRKKLGLPQNKKIILVPGQVDNDASILKSGKGLDSLGLLRQVRKTNPQSCIVFKPHPDVVSGQRPGISDAQTALPYADFYADEISITDLIKQADEIHTITSLAGFEALQYGKKVVCYGMPFYAGWGLTQDHWECPRRTRKLLLTELIAGTLIIYPRYFDPITSLPCGPEVAIERIRHEIRFPTPLPILTRIRRLQGMIKRRFIRPNWQ